MSKQIKDFTLYPGGLSGEEFVYIQVDGMYDYKYRLRDIINGLSKDSVGLGNVDNTSDSEKPVSIATQNALNLKANLQHGHSIADIAGLSEILDNKSNVTHTHFYQEIIGLEEALSLKADFTHTHDPLSLPGMQTLLDNKANVVHGHSITDIAGLQAELNDIRGNIVTLQQELEDIGPGDVAVGNLDW